MAKEPTPFSLKDVGTLKEGILAEEAGFKPLSNFGIDFTLRPETIFGALPFVGDMAIFGQAIGKVQTEDAASRFLNTLSPNQLDTGLGATLKRAGTGESATNAIIKDIKRFKENDPTSTSDKITRDDIQNYFMKKSPALDLAPIQTFTTQQGEIPDDTAFSYDRDRGVYAVTQPYQSGRFAQQMTGTTDETGLKGDDFKSAMGSYALSRAIDDNLKTIDQFAEDDVYQTNIIGSVNPRTGEKAYDKDFARAATLQNQGEPPSDPTFICTVLFEMNILPMSIYKYDQRYGQQVNRKIYNGYATWGKPIAERMRKEGLAFKIMKPIAYAWAEQMAYDLSEGKVGKNRISIKIGKFIGEAICYSIGLFIKPKGDKNGTSNRNRQRGEKRGVIHGKDGLPKRRGRPRTKR